MRGRKRRREGGREGGRERRRERGREERREGGREGEREEERKGGMEGREACVIKLHCILYEWSRARIFEDNLHANTTSIRECNHILVRGQCLCIQDHMLIL